ncbi:3'(2'),5'-bisphosphate nucleotidase CysQ [Campylobacter canadensis]|uniref:3'(2'),5'-bisphosphate nucleotidase CysQ n=1 Tax=Campylobacter canadensis TaxID=449520 RepID=A0ABS7WP47_9BACT|nr:3'(2'),5'-bisphosphate nucleotidase CysQ [Campylobacter canadensis]MBZ7986538.1 3'(2'),5'-bisphosphate nucleotidase CysQ [Campylobacter canadensis]MBZ7994057.1 3'(2'),5'-bisphosphate nucleotidase CysQ [Campylobacter canadensis]MBZ7995940.1 3'(2'),5'-bisphosphate nucleotidase CysQ [Campylobacter canadensis]MBZ7997574.1 3'(2'),5'-bisphosphate nucleotidase CysQ [Campylobacter canadensis]MBZ7999388.1 3'(2'),5'-bisphosphate nucleotidase CysQ [Campylobacter canadensis]
MQDLINIALNASKKAALYLKNANVSSTRLKQDGSLVSNVDLISNEIICDILSKSKYLICSEESILDYELRKNSTFWLIDPLDGTNNYLKNKKNYCICISLIENTRPILGLIYDVCNDNVYYSAINHHVYKNNTILKKVSKESKKALISLRKDDSIKNKDFALSHNFELAHIGSALKFCELLEGRADMYIRFENLNSWDLAAGDFLCNQSGGIMIGLDKKMLNYNKEDFKCSAFIALSNYYS